MLMSRPPAIDPDLLRVFAFIAEERSFTRAAQLVGRTQSAVSMQMQRLEALLGAPLLHRGRGGSVELTRHGQFLLERAHQMLALNDGIWSTFHEPSISGAVCLGTPDDYALRFLPASLKRFAESHPSVEVEVVCAPSVELAARLKAGMLDLALISEGQKVEGGTSTPLWHGPLVWVTSKRHSAHRLDPLPLALAAGDCCWRSAAIDRLTAAGRRFRIAYTSASQIGSLVPVMAGLAVTVAPATILPDELRVMGHEDNVPSLPDYQIMMTKGREARQPVTDLLADYIEETFLQDSEKPLRASPGLAA
jgi:DNA-binding transcriptional LysR family regulator